MEPEVFASIVISLTVGIIIGWLFFPQPDGVRQWWTNLTDKWLK